LEGDLDLTTAKLDTLCSSNCQTDIADVADRLALRCGEDILNLQIGNISFAEFGEFVKHRSDVLCLRESSGGPFCQMAMTGYVSRIPRIVKEAPAGWRLQC